MVQILSGLITYLLLAIYCHEQHGEQADWQPIKYGPQFRGTVMLIPDCHLILIIDDGYLKFSFFFPYPVTDVIDLY